jgi:hypothetical protein
MAAEKVTDPPFSASSPDTVPESRMPAKAIGFKRRKIFREKMSPERKSR